MGFSVVISAAVIFISFFASIAVILSVADNIYKANDAIINKAKASNTSIDISNLTVDADDRSHIQITLKNDGKSKLYNYTYFDLIVTYDAYINGDVMQVTEQLSYSDSLATGQWIITIQDDIIDPKILNPNETAIIDAMLNNIVVSNGKVIVTISTDDGSTATYARVI